MAVKHVPGYGPRMRIRLRHVVADHSFNQVGDALIATVILVASLVEIGAGSPEWSGGVIGEFLVAVACSVPLVWRRAFPIPVAVIVTGGMLAAGAIVAPVQGPFEVFVAFIIAFYSVGVHAPTRPGFVALVVVDVVGVLTWFVVALSVDGSNYGDWFPGFVWGVVAWGVGRVIRSRNLGTLELRRLSVELETEREARAQEAVSVERARIARELHDVVAHNISMMGVQAAAAGRIMQGGQPDVRRALDAIERTGRETVDEMRRMLGILRRSEDELALAPQPSLRDLGALFDQVRATGLDIDARVEGEPLALPASLDLSAYRIVQEALTNVLKHATPAHVEVVVRYTTDTVVLEIIDDGSGTADGRGTGNGLVGMRERVALFGGELSAGRRAEGGWALQATLPVGAV